MFKIAIVEDNAVEAAQLKNLINDYSAKTKKQVSLFFYSSGLDFLDNAKQSFDIVFMDIEMPVMDGLETAQHFRNVDQSSCLIFVTRMAQLAIKGYEVNAMDFIVKPVGGVEFGLKLDKAFAYCESQPKEFIVLHGKSGVFIVNIGDILYVEVLEHSVIVHTKDKAYGTKGALKEYESRLVRYGFVRCAKS
ncbi:MAG: response regulator transcription factor, partial [Clostridia bacterium]|nr:response regulator transcription factor [Clostridia bacterium]